MYHCTAFVVLVSVDTISVSLSVLTGNFLDGFRYSHHIDNTTFMVKLRKKGKQNLVQVYHATVCKPLGEVAGWLLKKEKF